jgi:hypothetical protein
MWALLEYLPRITNCNWLCVVRWDYLTEKFAYEKRVKENKLKVAMMQVSCCVVGPHCSVRCNTRCSVLLTQAKRSNAEIVQQIERTAVQRHVEERKRKRGDDTTADDAGSIKKTKGPGGDEKAAGDQNKARSFKQQRPIGHEYGEHLYKAQSKLLGKVFANTKKAE